MKKSKRDFRDFPGGPVVKTPKASNEMGTGSILLRELGSHMPHGSAKKKGFF